MKRLKKWEHYFFIAFTISALVFAFGFPLAAIWIMLLEIEVLLIGLIHVVLDKD